MSLKENLLGLGVFEDNKYLDFYCSLIEANNNTKKQKFVTQKHHIIPKAYFKFYALEVDNSSTNLINLKYSNHVLAHYYLCLCINQNKPNLLYRLQNAFFHMIKADANHKQKIDNFNLDVLPQQDDIYVSWKKLNSELQKGKTSWNKGLTKETDERVAKYSKPRHFSQEHNEHHRQALIRYYSTHPGTMTGKHLTQEQKDKISKATKDKPKKLKNPELTRKKLSVARKLYWERHKERKEKLVEYNRTRVLSENSHNKMSISQPNRKEVVQLDDNYNFIKKFNSIRKASIEMNISSWSVIKACKTKNPLDTGFYLLYWSDYEAKLK